MNGSRSTPYRHGDRSSLDALNRTIEGLEARIEGLMSGASREARSSDQRHERRTVPAANAHRVTDVSSDPLAEIRQRQRMLDADRSTRNEASRISETRRGERRYGETRRSEVRPPEASRPQERPAPPHVETPRYAEARHAAPPHREEVRHPASQPRAQALQTAQADSSVRDVAMALVSLRQELKQDISEGVAREMNALRAEIRSIKSIAEDQRFTDDLRSDLARLADGIDQLSHQSTPEAAGLRADFEELRAAMDGLAREDSVQRMESRWQGLADRMGDLDSAALREELVSLAYRIDEIKGQLGAMSDSPVIRALEQKLIAVASAMEQLGSRMQPNETAFAEQFATLDHRLDEISRAIAAGSRASAAASLDQSFLQRLEGRIGVLADQIEAMSEAAHRQVDPTGALSARIEALTGRIEELTDEQAAMRLEERLEQLSLILEQAQKPVPQSDLSDYLADISRKIDGLEHGAVNDLLAERLDYLARRIDEMDFQPPIPAIDHNAFGRIEDRLGDIATRLDQAAAAPRSDESALRNLEDQIAHLSTLISQPQPAVSSLPAEFESRMTAIENYMATNDEYIIEAARQAAEAVVEAYSRDTTAGNPAATADMAVLSALADDLRHLEDLTRSSEERTHQTFEALHSTLVKIADRLDGMEGRITASAHIERHYSEPEGQELHRPAAAMPVAAQLSVSSHDEVIHEENAAPVATFGTREQPVHEASDAGELLSADRADTQVSAKTVKPSLLTELSRRLLPGGKKDAASSRTVVEPAPSIDPSDVLPPDHENDLLEPGSGAPDVKKILERVRASQAAGEFDTDRAAGAARADYIAAARRAAKAAAQETDPSQTTSSARDMRKATKATTGKGLGAVLSRHRRPILMAVGAVLLALMAMPLAKTLTSGVKAPPAPPAAIEAPAEPSAPPADQTGSEAPAIDNRAATDGVDSDADIASAQATPPAEPPRQISPGNHLTDPTPGAGEVSTMEPAGSASQAQEEFVPAQQAEAPVQIAVPAGIEPKSLADAAAAGDPNALFEIGARFTEGRGVATDLSEAANWYKLAADRGLPPAQYRLANLFEKGSGITRDLTKAMTYYKQAAEAGNASAMHNLAVLYASGAAGQPDYAAAVEWFSKAADLGVADSQFNLAILYARGNGVKQDLESSYKWFAIAAKGGDKDAAQKRDEVANAMRKEQLESARAKADLWKVKPLDPKANSINLPDEWASGKPLTTASVDMEKAIRNIQAILGKNGFDAGVPDGKMGAKTVAAIKAFQTSVGQEPTGKINDALVKELLARNK